MKINEPKFNIGPVAAIISILSFFVFAPLLMSRLAGSLSGGIFALLLSAAACIVVAVLVQLICNSAQGVRPEQYEALEDDEEGEEDQEEAYSTVQYEEVQEVSLMDKYQSLEKLAELKEKGILTEEEFNSEKAKILNGSRPAVRVQPATAPQQPIIINNSNSNVNEVYTGINAKNKWVALILCLFLGIVGAHKFYEGKILLGILYLCTGGLAGIGVLVDFFAILFKPNPYYC